MVEKSGFFYIKRSKNWIFLIKKSVENSRFSAKNGRKSRFFLQNKVEKSGFFYKERSKKWIIIKKGSKRENYFTQKMGENRKLFHPKKVEKVDFFIKKSGFFYQKKCRK